MPLAHVIEVNALTLDGADGPRLTANWSWAGALLDEAAVRDLAQTWLRALEALTRHAAQPGAGGSSPSDVALVDLSQARSSGWSASTRAIEDILPLSPLQEGLLFHALYDAQRPDVYTVQLELELEGALDPATLQARCRRWSGGMPACGRASGMSGSAVRCRWCWGGSRCRGGWSICRSVMRREQQQQLAELLAADRLERFDLAAPPLLRFALMRLVCAAAPAADQQPSPFDGRLVGADPGAGAAGSLCAGWQRGCRCRG